MGMKRLTSHSSRPTTHSVITTVTSGVPVTSGVSVVTSSISFSPVNCLDPVRTQRIFEQIDRVVLNYLRHGLLTLAFAFQGDGLQGHGSDAACPCITVAEIRSKCPMACIRSETKRRRRTVILLPSIIPNCWENRDRK